MPRETVVLHSTSIWLPQTEAWLDTQLRFLPREIVNAIVCFRTQNLDQFPVPGIHALADGSRFRYFAEQALRKARPRSDRPFVARTVREVSAHILHSHFGTRGWENVETARRARLPHIVTFYGFDATYLPRQDARWYRRYAELFEAADRILCEAPFMAKCLIELGAPAEKVVVNHLGVAVDEIAFVPRQRSEGEPFRILISGSFQEKKGIPYAVEAVGKVSSEISVELTIIGDANPTQERSRAEKRHILAALERTGLAGQTRLLGFQPHATLVEEAYKHHVLLAPSVTARNGDTEGGLPYTITELVPTGILVVSTSHCDIPEVIEHGVTGLLAEERDSDGLAEHLGWLANSPGEWLRLAQAGRARVESDFNAARQGARLAKIYEAMLECRSSSSRL